MDIKKLELLAKKVSLLLFKKTNAQTLGAFKSFFRGQGLVFKEHNTYAIGDDLRFLDWKLFAKTEKLFIKKYEEERNLQIYVVIDCSNSMHYGHMGISKFQASLEICSLMMLIAEKTKDLIRPIVIADKVYEGSIGNGLSGITNFISLLRQNNILNTENNIKMPYQYAEINENVVLEKIKRYYSLKKNILLISDFVDFIDLDKIKYFLHQGRFSCCQVLAPLDLEKSLPFAVTSSNEKTQRPFSFRKNNYHKILKETYSKPIFKKIIFINIEDNYLQSFIKGLLRVLQIH